MPVGPGDPRAQLNEIDHGNPVHHFAGVRFYFVPDSRQVGGRQQLEVLRVHPEQLIGPGGLTLYPPGQQPVVEGCADDQHGMQERQHLGHSPDFGGEVDSGRDVRPFLVHHTVQEAQSTPTPDVLQPRGVD